MNCPVKDCEATFTMASGVELVRSHDLAMYVLLHLIEDHKLVEAK